MLLAVLAGCDRGVRPSSEAAGAQPPPAATSTPPRAAANAEPIRLKALQHEERPHVAPVVVKGTGIYVTNPGTSRAGAQPNITAGDPISLDFVNVDVRDVVKSVLGDLLKLSYVIDPAVQGAVTLRTSTPLPRSDVLPALENALRLSGIALVQADGIVNVVPIANAARVADAGTGQAPGFIARMVTPRFVAAADLQRVLEPILPPGTTLRVDPARNLLIVTGPARSVAAVLANVAVFDTDYLKGMSFALLPLKNAQAKDVVKEVTDLLSGSGHAISGMVRVMPIDRLNALLVTAIQPAYLDRVRAWVDSLDQGAEDSLDQRLFVYRVQNGRASDLANVLGKALGIEASGGVTQASQPPSAAAPATAMTAPTGPSFAAAGPAPAGSASSNPLLGGVPNASSGPGLSPLAGVAAASGSSSAMSDIRVTADEANNALLVMATPQQYATVEAALRQLDIPPLQVQIDVTVAEVDLTNQLAYGLEYYVKSGSFQALFAQDTQQTQNTTSGSSGIPFSGFGFVPGFNLAFTGGGGSSVVLQALQQLTTLHVLSAPTLVVVNNQSARIQVGDEVPITTQSAVSVLAAGSPVVNSIEYQDTGVILQVRPRVNASGNVMLDLSQEVSQVAPTTSSTLNTPTISQRRVSSTIDIANGQTVALGGLISDSSSVSNNGIPVLQDLPIIGALFGSRGNSKTRTELIILITPHVIRSAADSQAVTDELERKLPLTIPIIAGRPR